MKLNPLTLKDKKKFNKFLSLSRHELSVYAFENIYLWKGLFEVRWAVIEGCLCVFFQDKIGRFLYLPPLSETLKPQVIIEVFKIMDALNRNREVSRIENVEEKDVDAYRRLGYACVKKPSDYLCLRRDLAELKGNKFKSKRSSANYFLKHYQFSCAQFLPRQKNDCLELYRRWQEGRKDSSKDKLYRGMLEDNLVALKTLLDNYRHLNCAGRIVKVGDKLKAFTFGFPLNQDTFCILYEITDLSVKGLAQFIFREFCRELAGYKYINIMDDCGLANLKKVKLSYRPVKLVPAYIVKRK